MKKIITNLNKKWSEKNTLQKIEHMLTYTILAALLLAVVPAFTLQMQLYKLQKSLAEENLTQCEKIIEKTMQKASATEDENEESFFYSAPAKDSDTVALVQEYFNAYNQGNMYTACDHISDNRCNAENPVDLARFQSLRDNLVGGYQNLHLWESDQDQDFHSDVVCVQYDYTYANDLNQKKVTEVLSYYVNDGKITARVCEKMTFDGETENECPILSARDFCLSQ